MKALILPALALATATNQAAAEPQAGAIHLPAEIAYPEGVAFDPATRTVHVVGTTTGIIGRIDATTGRGKALGQGFASQIGEAFPGVLGLKRDRNRLVMAGGTTAKIFIADVNSGKLVGTVATAEGRGLLNDLAIVGRTAFFTDTFRPILWSMNLDGPTPKSATNWLSFTGTALEYAEGPNLNGIVGTPDGKALIVGQMNKGLLFKIDIATRRITPIDLGGELVEGVDGLVLRGDILFVVRQPAAEIVTIRLTPGRDSGQVLKRTKPAGLQWPATAALDGDALIVVNSQFNQRTGDTAQRPFSLSRVPLSLLGVD